MSTLESIKTDIAKLKSFLNTKYAISDIYIFGSFAREEQREESDIDLLVDFYKTPDLLTFIELEDFLSTKLHHKVDLVPKRKLKPQIRDQIMHEAIAV